MSRTPKPSPVSLKLLKVAVAIVLVGVTTAIAACNTTEGVGKDVKSVGRGIESSAEKNK